MCLAEQWIQIKIQIAKAARQDRIKNKLKNSLLVQITETEVPNYVFVL